MAADGKTTFTWQLAHLRETNLPFVPKDAHQIAGKAVAKALRIEVWDGNRSEVRDSGGFIMMDRKYPEARTEADEKDRKTADERMAAGKEWEEFWYRFVVIASAFNLFPHLRDEKIQRLADRVGALEEAARKPPPVEEEEQEKVLLFDTGLLDAAQAVCDWAWNVGIRELEVFDDLRLELEKWK